MSNPAESQARRRFLKLATTAAIVAPIAAVVLPQIALADALAPLDPNDPTAKALHYTDDASTASSNPTYKAGSACASCQFYQGKAGDASGPCMLFPAKAVNAKGWCASYNKKA
ncbi:MAG: high-potential iron-sulfur protein [Dokdonella sp.]